MLCLKGYIGLKGCGNTTPPSGRYVNSLPGVTLKAIDNLASSEQVTYSGVWDNIEDRAIYNLSTRVTAKFAERYRLKKVLSTIDLGESIDSTDNQTTAAQQYRGFTYELKLANTYLKPSALQQVYVQKIKVYLKSTGDFTVKIFDLDLKKEIYTKAVTGGVIGWNTVNVYQCFSAFRLFFAYNATSIESVYQSISTYAQDCCDSCITEIYGSSCNGYIRGAHADTSSPYTISQGSNSFGLTAEISLLCSFDNVVCKNLKALETPFWYALGEELMVERLASPRFNITTIDAKEAEELRSYFSQKFNDELALVVDGIDLDLSDCCIECNAALMYSESRM